MRFNSLLGDDKAVSPVIGVILMVAITVILAAVIGTFVLGLGQNIGNSAPQATLEVSASPGSPSTVTIGHNGGDALHSDRTRVVVEVTGDHAGTSTFDPEGSDVLSVGGESTISIAGTTGTPAADSIDWGDGTGTYNAAVGDGDGAGEVSSGDTVSIELIDTESQRVIFETEVTA